MKKTAIVGMVLFCAILVTSSVTAVPSMPAYLQNQNQTQQMGQLTELLNQVPQSEIPEGEIAPEGEVYTVEDLQEMVDSDAFQYLAEQCEEYLIPEKSEFIETQVTNYLLGILPDYDPLLPLITTILVVVAELIMILLGHGTFGINVALLVDMIIMVVAIIPSTIILGALEAFSDSLMVFVFLDLEYLFYEFGLVGGAIAILVLIIAFFGALIILTPVSLILTYMVLYIETLTYIAEYFMEFYPPMLEMIVSKSAKQTITI